MRDLLRPYPYPTQFCSLPYGGELAYMDLGEGPDTVLMVHGLASYAPTWVKNLEALHHQYRCVAVDLPGFGRSGKGAHTGLLSHYADTLMRLMDKLSLERVALMGHSMGGQISMHVALRHPDRVSRLVLVAPAGFETFKSTEKLWLRKFYSVDSILNTSVKQVRKNYGYNFFSMPDDIELWMEDRLRVREATDFGEYANAVVQSVGGMLDEPVFDRLGEIHQPTLVIYGEEDFLIPSRVLHPGVSTREIAELGSAQIPQATLELIPEAGHFVQYEQPELTNQAILDFLAE